MQIQNNNVGVGRLEWEGGATLAYDTSGVLNKTKH
jgi:hypothetical protein